MAPTGGERNGVEVDSVYLNTIELLFRIKYLKQPNSQSEDWKKGELPPRLQVLSLGKLQSNIFTDRYNLLMINEIYQCFSMLNSIFFKQRVDFLCH
jgi:hypothetical protein